MSDMTYHYHHLDKWIYANIDLAEEILEKGFKALILLSGASSSGKSYSALCLSEEMKRNGHRPLILSLDQYNIGISGIIVNKVNENAFEGRLDHLASLRSAIKNVIMPIPFSEKFNDSSLAKIAPEIQGMMSPDQIQGFLSELQKEWKKLNFDEPTVYDLKEASLDLRELLSGKDVTEKKYSKKVSERIPSDVVWHGGDYDVLIVEGIYALNPLFLNELTGLPLVKNFVDGNPKTLFLRRIIRDKTLTSASTAFTMSMYFGPILKAYEETILPTRSQADIILANDMTFQELRSGNLYKTKDEIMVSRETYLHLLTIGNVLEEEYQKDIFFNVLKETQEQNNILRLRLLSKDKGETYSLSSLVHKGAPKVRFDHKIIRPIHILLDEQEIHSVFKNAKSACEDFLRAGFVIGKQERKRKTKISCHGRILTIRDVESRGFFVEYSDDLAALTEEELMAL